ncbi:MAG: hypothetical protein D6714_02710 [Bacteroidetes bacterium]|nr:MAG: hypothetical protein D6714_02710 [Bacteroidota bacterium]
MCWFNLVIEFDGDCSRKIENFSRQFGKLIGWSDVAPAGFPDYAYMHTLDVSEWAAGVYFVSLVWGREVVKTVKLVVVR